MDRQEVLNWILDLLEKMKSQPADDGILKLYLPLALQYLNEFVQSELLSRRLGYLCCKKLNFMLNNVAESNLMTSPTQNNNINIDNVKIEPKDNADKDGTNKKDLTSQQLQQLSPIQSTFIEYQNCPHHRDLSNLICIFCNSRS